MEIITWNVNGYRAALAKGALQWIQHDPADVVCLQEVKATPQQLAEQDRTLPGYHAHWNPAQKLGYSGVVTLTRTPPLETRLGLGLEHFDVEGRVLVTRHPGFLLFNIYFPNGQRGQERVQYKLDFYAALLAECGRLHAAGERIILTGDFNTAHQEIDLARPKSNALTSGFLPEERAWVTRYLENGFVDAFRALYPDKVEYTWWTYIAGARHKNIGWRIDYFLVSESLRSQVLEVKAHPEIHGSDHCPVRLTLRDE